MKRIVPACFIWLILIMTTVIPFEIQAQDNQVVLKDIEGYWSGKLKIQSTLLKLDMNVMFNETDSATITFDSPDQGILDLPTDKVTLTKDSLYVSAKAIGGRYTGKISEDVNVIAGAWYQGGMSFPLTLERQGQRTSYNRPQEPKPPFPYRVQEMTFPNVGGGFDLSGTLTLPEQKGKYPLAILVTGSGPQNRDEELLGHKPFLVLADFLTRQGFAVFRYDDRGYAKSKGDFKTATTFDFASDAASALDFLKKQPEIDSARIGIIGHSEGGMVAPIVASQRNDVAFIVLMAGPGVPGDQILLLQSSLISKAAGADEKTIQSNAKMNRDCYAVVKKTSDSAKAEQKLKILFEDFNKKNAKDTSYHEMSDREITSQIKTLTSPWFRCFLTLNPEVYLSKVKCPVLAINGSLDLQVPPKENLQAIEKALIFGGNSKYEIKEFPGLNHLFQTAKTGSPAEYVRISETMSPAVLEFIGKWMQKTTKR
jgi:uncharacterized protein